MDALNYGDLLGEHARSRPHLTAVVDDPVRLTYIELAGRVDRLVTLLASAGVERRTTVAWLGQNSFRTLECVLACAKLGAVLCPVNWRQSVAELAYTLRDLAPRVVVWQQEAVGEQAAAAREQAADAEWLRHDGGDSPYEQRLAVATPTDPDTGADVGAMQPLIAMYTAAFDGRPQAAFLTHLGLQVQGLLLGSVQGISDESVFLNSGPLFHIGTLGGTLATFLFGGTNVFLPRVDAERICQLIERERCTCAFLMPPTVEQIREVNRDGRYDLTSLWPSADPETWHQVSPSWSRATGRSGGYGQTQLTGVNAYLGLGRPVTGNAGRPQGVVQLRIVDPDGREVAGGEVGEIVARGPTVMVGRHGAEGRGTSGTLDWHRTGDLGRRDPDGSLTFVGPMTTMIKSGAENVYPVEVEKCLRTHPAVEDAAVLGVPDRRWGQRVKAVVVPADGASLSADDVVEHCRRHIASYKKPREVEFADRLPRLPDGRLDRVAVDAQYGGGGYPGLGHARGRSE